jgi:RES domain
VKAPGVIYRLGRKPDPWAPPDWASAGPDGTFGNRFDDPDATYRVLYASSQRLGCFLETLARFRIDPTLLTELAQIEGPDDYCPLGEVPMEWVGEADHGTCHDRQGPRRRLQQRVDQPLAKVIGKPFEEVWSRGVRRVGPATDGSKDSDAVRVPDCF